MNEIVEGNELVLLSNKDAASFSVVKERPYPQIELVIELLKNHIADKRPITKDDICLAYAKFKTLKTGYYYRWCWLDGKWGNHKLQVENLIKDPFIQYHSLTWFKNVLGMAIIRGKILAIPIIEI